MNRRSFLATQRREQVAELYCEGYSQRQIAAMTGVSQRQIFDDIEIIKTRWEDAMAQYVMRQKAEQLARINHTIRVCWQSFRLSREAKESTETEQTESDGSTTRKARVRKEGTAGNSGNPTWISLIQKAYDQRAELLGLNAPQRFQIDWDVLTPEQMLRLEMGDPPELVLSMGSRPALTEPKDVTPREKG